MSVAVPVATAWTNADDEEVRQLLAELDDMATLDGGASPIPACCFTRRWRRFATLA